MRTVEQGYAAEIAKREKSIQRLKQKMEQASKQFIAVAGDFLESWYPAKARELIEQEDHITTTLSRDALRAMKAAVKALASRADTIAEEHLNAPTLWWHRDEAFGGRNIRGGPYDRPKSSYEQGVLGEPLRYAMGELAAVFESHGFFGDHRQPPTQQLAKLRGIEIR